MSILDQIAQGPKVGGLKIAEAGATGTKAGLEVATQSLANKISTAKYEDYLASAEQRRAARQADTMKSEEFVSPEQQQQRAQAVQTNIASEQNKQLAQQHEVLFYKTQDMSPQTTQEQYDKIYATFTPEEKKSLGLNGSKETDYPRIAFAQRNARDNLPHLRAMDEARAKALGNKTPKVPPKPEPFTQMDAGNSVAMILKDPDLTSRGWFNSTNYNADSPEIKLMANQVMMEANAISSKAYSRAYIQSQQGADWSNTLVSKYDAMQQALFKTKAFLVSMKSPDLKFLDPVEANKQQNDWMAAKDREMSMTNTAWRSMPAMVRDSKLRQTYQDHMQEYYNRMLNLSHEKTVYGG